MMRVSLRKCFGELSDMVFALRCANSVRGIATTVCVSWCVHQNVSVRVLGLDLFVVLAPTARGTSLKLLRRTQCAFD